jgi:hypothetical protein
VCVAGVAGTFVIAQSAQAQSATPAKQSQIDALYHDKPKNGQLCGICNYFQPPTDCQKVVGPVRPTGWCKNFQKKA